MSPEFSDNVAAATAGIREKCDGPVDLALVAGTGLGVLTARITADCVIPYGEIGGFAVSTAPGHQGALVIGTLNGRRVAALSGRFHLYEGWSAEDIVLPIYVLRQLGAQRLVITNAAGALRSDLAVADALLITDHISFQGQHPLAGPNDDKLGPRFPDMSRAYDPELCAVALKAAGRLGIDLPTGIYAAVHGPEFETSAERRFLRLAGGDVVGMSTVLEVTAANHCGMSVLGFSAITNAATGGPDQLPDTIEEILANADRAAGKMQQIILAMISDGDL